MCDPLLGGGRACDGGIEEDMDGVHGSVEEEGPRGSGKMSLDIAFQLLGWGQDDWPTPQEVKKRHREMMRSKHPDKAPAGKHEEYTRIAARLNHAKEIILRAHSVGDVLEEEGEGEKEKKEMVEKEKEKAKEEKEEPRDATPPQRPSPSTLSSLTHASAPRDYSLGHLAGADGVQGGRFALKDEVAKPDNRHHQRHAHQGDDDVGISRQECRGQAVMEGAGGGLAAGRGLEGGDDDVEVSYGHGEGRERSDGAGSARGLEIVRGVEVECGRGGEERGRESGACGGRSEGDGGGERRGEAVMLSSGGKGEMRGEAPGCRGGETTIVGGEEEEEDLEECVVVTMRSAVPPWVVIISNLKLLAQVRENDKLVVSGEKITIDSSGVLGGVSRWLSSQGRSQTTSWLSRFSSNVSHYVQLLIAGIASREEEGVQERDSRAMGAGGLGGGEASSQAMSRSSMLATIAWEIGPCIQGIRRLRVTYESDPGVISRLDKVIVEMSESRESVHSWLKAHGYSETATHA